MCSCFQVKAAKDIEEKEKVISEKNMQLLDMEKQMEELHVRQGNNNNSGTPKCRHFLGP